MEDHPLGHAAPRPNAGPDDPGGAPGRLEVRAGGSELVLDQRHRLGLEHILGRDGILLVVPRPGVAGQPGGALILDGPAAMISFE